MEELVRNPPTAGPMVDDSSGSDSEIDDSSAYEDCEWRGIEQALNLRSTALASPTEAAGRTNASSDLDVVATSTPTVDVSANDTSYFQQDDPESARKPQHCMKKDEDDEKKMEQKPETKSNEISKDEADLSPTHKTPAGQTKSKPLVSLDREQSAAHRIESIKSRWGGASTHSLTRSADDSSEDGCDDDSSRSEMTVPLNDELPSSSGPLESKDSTSIRTARPRPGLKREASGRRSAALQAFKVAATSVRSNITEKENFNFKTIIRENRQVDMETGAKTTREFTAQRIVDPEYWTPMNPKERRKKMLMRKTKESLKPEVDLEVMRAAAYLNGSKSGTSRRHVSLGLNGSNRNNNSNNNNNNNNNHINRKRDSERQPSPQYRIRSLIEKNDHTFMKNSFNIVREYLYWCFRKTFLMVVVTESVIFLCWCWGFAILYYILGRLNPQCIQSHNGYNFEEADMGLVDAFTLSWTTFSTVGYGSIHPAVRGEGTSTGCVLVTILASLQSFVGVLSASLCSAIIFSKIARTQSIAHVIFSDTMVIRFGKELMQAPPSASTRNLNFNQNSKRGKSISRYPCPILEFRVVNLLHSEKGGEIMNCKLNVVSSTLKEVSKNDTNDDSRTSFFGVLPPTEVVRGMVKSLRTSRSSKSGVGPPRTGGSIIQKVNRSITDYTSSHNMFNLDSSDGTSHEAEALPFKEENPTGVHFDELDDLSQLSQDGPEDLQQQRAGKNDANKSGKQKRKVQRAKSVYVDEEPGVGTKPASKRIFAKLDLETDSHPFLKRVWNIRHKLTHESPLLNEDIRDLIRLNGGLWPAALCNAEVIRECLDLSQLIVTLNGTNVASGSSVYKLHVYDTECMMIGRTFENPLALGSDGKLIVDMGLVHTTIPQHEGGNDDGSNDGSNVKERDEDTSEHNHRGGQRE